MDDKMLACSSFKKKKIYVVSLGVEFLKTQSCGEHGVERMLSLSTGMHVQPARVGLLLAVKSWQFFNLGKLSSQQIVV